MERLNSTDAGIADFPDARGAAASTLAADRSMGEHPAQPLSVEVRLRGRVSMHSITGATLIGRTDRLRSIYPAIDLSLDDAVSRRHASISLRDGSYWIRDLQSLNGTRLNGRELTPGREFQLSPGDELWLGECTRLRIVQVPPPECAAGPRQADLPHLQCSSDPDELQALRLIEELLAD